MLKATYTKSFKKDYKKIKKQGKKISLLHDVLFDLMNELTLNKKLRDHSLAGNYKGKRECHLAPDWLLIYEIDKNHLVLHRTGSHSELFNK